MDNQQPIYDEHTLYIKCGTATANDIRQAFSETLSKYKREVDQTFQCRSRVNLVESRDGKSFGIAFVFLTNPAAYHMLLGKNPDGTDRIEYIDDPTWEPPSEGELTNRSGWSSITDLPEDIDWGDISDDEDDYPTVCPKIARQLPPLMVLPPYKLTPEQMEEERQSIIEDNLGKKDFDPNKVEIKDDAHFIVDRSFAFRVEDHLMPNILKTTFVPPWITKDDLKAEFRNYASDSVTLQERQVKGIIFKEAFPYVNINENRVAFVIFDQSTNDAYFALHMMKKTTINRQIPASVFKNSNPFNKFFPDSIWNVILKGTTDLTFIKESIAKSNPLFKIESMDNKLLITRPTDDSHPRPKHNKPDFTISTSSDVVTVSTFNTQTKSNGFNIYFSATLTFAHSYKSDRDLMSNICQQPRPVNKSRHFDKSKNYDTTNKSNNASIRLTHTGDNSSGYDSTTKRGGNKRTRGYNKRSRGYKY